jgi:plasmid stabilization system protein ParE
LKPVDISPAAIDDLLAITVFLVSESDSLSLKDRFIAAAASTLNTIETFPLCGRARPTRHPRLSALRSLRIDPPFGKYLIFYQATPSASLILRVLHGAQDIHLLLDIDAERDA